MGIYAPPENRGKDVTWEELTPKEQEKLYALGYRPPVGSLLHNNLGINDETLGDTG